MELKHKSISFKHPKFPNNSPLTISTYECSCGGEIREVGNAGCTHDDDRTYFFQCKICKDVYTSGRLHSSPKEYLEAGWEIIK